MKSKTICKIITFVELVPAAAIVLLDYLSQLWSSWE